MDETIDQSAADDVKPLWALREVPEHVRRTWPSVVEWRWLSPLRLCGKEAMNEGRSMHLVVIDAHTAEHAMGQAIPAEQMHDTDHVARVFARLRLALGRDIALRVACQDGTPVRAEHDLKRCQWCGKAADDHPVQHEDPDPVVIVMALVVGAQVAAMPPPDLTRHLSARGIACTTNRALAVELSRDGHIVVLIELWDSSVGVVHADPQTGLLIQRTTITPGRRDDYAGIAAAAARVVTAEYGDGHVTE
jgi:hypothetical protein